MVKFWWSDLAWLCCWMFTLFASCVLVLLDVRGPFLLYLWGSGVVGRDDLPSKVCCFYGELVHKLPPPYLLRVDVGLKVAELICTCWCEGNYPFTDLWSDCSMENISPKVWNWKFQMKEFMFVFRSYLTIYPIVVMKIFTRTGFWLPFGCKTIRMCK